MIKVRSVLKKWFSRGKRPTEEQFADLIDSFYHKTEDPISADTIEGLAEALASKSNVGHKHSVEDIAGLDGLSGDIDPSVLATKADKNHTHAMSDVNGLSEALADIMPSEHTHAMSEVNGLNEALDNKADKATTLAGYHIDDAYTKTETDALLDDKADKATTLAGYHIDDAYTKTETDALLNDKADQATTLAGYNIDDAYTKSETDALLNDKADKATTLAGYNIDDAYTKSETDAKLETKADKATTLAGYNIDDAYTKTETDAKLETKADKATTYTKTQVDEKLEDKVIESIEKRLLVDLFYPVGSIFSTLDASFDPNVAYAGTAWQKMADGLFLESTTDAEQVGAEVQAGLPNITGHFTVTGGGSCGFWMSCSGAFTGRKKGPGKYIQASGGSDSGLYNGFDLNAKLSSAVYGGSDTVQPHSIKVFRWIRVAVEPVAVEE